MGIASYLAVLGVLLQVIKMDDCIGAEVEERIASMGAGEVMLLENVRFHPGEEVREAWEEEVGGHVFIYLIMTW